MLTARQIYDLCIDMDFMDYEETIEDDLLFIQALIETIGEQNALSVLLELKED